MKEKILTVQRICLVGGVMLAALFMTGCCCCNTYKGAFACPENLKQDFPVITCQPMDVRADINQKATFYVNADGKNLSYQWHYIGGGLSADPVAIPGANKATYTIPSVVPLQQYGLYFCAVYKGSSPHRVTQSRMATLGGKGSIGAGGTFASVQNAVQGSGSSSVCGHAVGAKWVGFSPAQAPLSPDFVFQGTLTKIVSGVELPISRSTYYLQWLNSNDSAQKDCCNDVTTDFDNVYACLTPGTPYLFTAFFKSGQAPPLGTTVILKGTWASICPSP
jgi:hypothetical protein